MQTSKSGDVNKDGPIIDRVNYSSKDMAESVTYLWIKQSVRVSDVVLVTV